MSSVHKSGHTHKFQDPSLRYGGGPVPNKHRRAHTHTLHTNTPCCAWQLGVVVYISNPSTQWLRQEHQEFKTALAT